MESYLSLSLADVSTGSTCKTFTSLKADTIPLGRGGRGNQDCNLLTSGLFRSDQTKCMSQKHAELSWDKGEYAFLKDVGSTNGTFVEREGAEAWKLKAGIPYRVRSLALWCRVSWTEANPFCRYSSRITIASLLARS